MLKLRVKFLITQYGSTVYIGIAMVFVFPPYIITQYGSTVYIGIAMVFVFSPYIREIQFLLSVSSQFDF